jgi:hypothetical protein
MQIDFSAKMLEVKLQVPGQDFPMNILLNSFFQWNIMHYLFR